jgi:TatA/E family protein of Tat protein translocase
MPFNIGPGELILILIIALVLLGPSKLPDVASSLGKSVREFRKAATDLQDAGKLDTPPATAPAAQAPASAPPAPAAAPDAPPPAAAAAAAAAEPAPAAEPASEPDRT